LIDSHLPPAPLVAFSGPSSFEYYDWEDAMEDFLLSRGLESRMKIFFARRIFSASVLQWWIKVQQGLIDRCEESCRT
jgi:hypothetical protein